MDPISLAANIIGILVTFSSKICSSISDLRPLCKTLPGRIPAVRNEVADLELVLLQVNNLIQDRVFLPRSKYSAVPPQLKQAKLKLNGFESIINNLSRIYLTSKTPPRLMHA